MPCTRCGAPLRHLDDDLCDGCVGGSVASEDREPAAARPRASLDAPRAVREVGPLLSRANLLRMRGQWEEAADLCAQALRGDPQNPTTHSLLGDIYHDQGRPEEARHWYRLALELNPDSEADRTKLGRAEETLEARRQRAEWEAVIEGRSQPVATSLLVRESLQRIGAVAGAVLCAMILVMATLISVADRQQARNPEAAASAPYGRGRGAIVTDTRPERRLVRRMGTTLPGGIGQIIRLELQPRSHSAELRVFVPRSARNRRTPVDFRRAVIREAYRAAHVFFAAQRLYREVDFPIESVEVEIIGPVTLPDGSAETDLLFSGTLAPADLGVNPDAIAEGELDAFFGRLQPPYWAPDLRDLR